MKKLMKKFLASAIASAMLMTGMLTTDVTAMPVEQPTVAEQLATQTQDQVVETVMEQPQAVAQDTSTPKSSKFVQLDNKEITMEVGETIQGKLVTDAIVDKSGWEADKVSTSDKSVVGLSGKDRYAGTIDYVAKKAGTATVTWQLKTDKRKKNNTKVLTSVVTVVEPQVQQPEQPATEITVSNQQELTQAILDNNIQKITIATEATETFNIANYGNRDLSQVELTVNAPQAEVSNSALFKSITIEAIASNTWMEYAVGNKFTVNAPKCHIFVATSAVINSIVCGSDQAVVELEVFGTINKIQTDRKVNLNINGETEKLVPIVIGAGAANTNLTATLPLEIELQAVANLTFEKGAEKSTVTNLSGIPVVIKTPSGEKTIGIGSSNVAISSSSNSNWSDNSPWFPPTWGNGNPDKGENGNNDNSSNSGTNGGNNSGNSGNNGEGNGNNNSGGNQGGNSNKPEDPVNPSEPEVKLVNVTIIAGEGGSATGTGQYVEGTTGTATATPNPGYEFVGWSNGSTANPLTFVAKEGLSLTANFRKKEEPVDPPTPPTPSEEENTFKLEVSCGEGGYVTIEGVQQNSFSVVSPSAIEYVTVEAHSNPGYHFGKWNDGDTSSTKTVPVIFGTSVGYSCSFELDQVEPPKPEMVTIDVSAANEGGSVYGSTTVEKGSSVTFGANPDEGYTVEWNDGSTETERTISATENMNFVATFVKTEEPPVEELATVTFIANGKVVKEASVNKGSAPEIPSADDCYVFGKKLVAWEAGGVNYSVDDISGLVAAISTLTQEGDVTVTAVYEDEVQTSYYLVHLKNGSISASNEPNEDGKYRAGTEIIFKADDAPEGKKFSHLLITSLGSTTEYGETTYRRILNNNITIEAVYVDENEEVVKPISLLLTPSHVTVNGKPAIRLYATLGFETGLHGEKLELGILRTCNPNATLTLENEGIDGVVKRTTGNSSDVTFANSVYSEDLTGENVYAVAYLKYIDTDGNEQVKYTSVVTFSVKED